MSQKIDKNIRTAIRYKKKAVKNEEWIKAFLHQAAFCTIATVYDDQPYAHSNLFVYDEGEQAIYFHTAQEGRTRTNIDHNNRVCFSISEMGRLLPAETALNFSVEYAGVTVFGSASIIEDDGKAARALQMLLDKYFTELESGKDYRPITQEELDITAVYRIDIEEWSGKQNKKEADFPGAFIYSAPDSVT